MGPGTLDLTSTLPFINSGGVLGILIWFIYGGFRKWWYYGHIYEAKAKEAEDWKQLALGGINTIKSVVEVMEPIIDRMGKSTPQPR